MYEQPPSRFEQLDSPETATERSLELLDATHEIELILSAIIEGGPELDPFHLARLYDYLEDLLDQSGIKVEASDPFGGLRDAKERVGVSASMVDDLLSRHSIPEELRQAVEKIIAGRTEGLSDSAIYRRLARVYHPDQTFLNPLVAEETFKLIGQLLYDRRSGFSEIFDAES